MATNQYTTVSHLSNTLLAELKRLYRISNRNRRGLVFERLIEHGLHTDNIHDLAEMGLIAIERHGPLTAVVTLTNAGYVALSEVTRG